MSRSRTFLVLDKRKVTHTLPKWCKKVGLKYDTVLARIMRAEARAGKKYAGVITFKYNDKLLSPEVQERTYAQ